MPFLVYTASFDDDAAYHRSAVNNIGNEVGSYLSFIVDYYNCLPDVSFSPTRFALQSTRDAARVVNSLTGLLQAILFAHAHRFSKLHTYHTLDFDANNVRYRTCPRP